MTVLRSAPPCGLPPGAEGGRTTGALLLAGGAGRRMGQDKGSLPFLGSDFLTLIAGELRAFDERLLSLSAPGGAVPAGFTPVTDDRPGCGPLGGICAGLRVCRSDFLFVVACDMPLFQEGLARYLCAFLCGEYDVFLPVDRAGRPHPLCAVYGKSALPVLERQLRGGQYRMMDALAQLRVKYVPLAHSAYADEVLSNINTREEYQRLLRGRGGHPPILAVCGVKNSGKTTFLCGLIPQLTRLGLRVAAIKHDGHDFEPDRPGTDSFRLLGAGAVGAAVYSGHRYQLVCQQPRVQVPQLARAFGDADLILLEGGRRSPYPKLELVRSPVSSRPTAPAETLVAVCTNCPRPEWGVPLLALDDYEGAARRIASRLSSGWR